MSWIGDRLLALSACLCETLEQRGAGRVCRCEVAPGAEVALDACDCDGDRCGQAWVRLVSAFPSSSLPEPDIDARCTAPLAYVVEVGAVRCAPVADDDEGVVLGTTLGQYDDMDAMRYALQCCFTDGEQVLGQYEPYGPQGGCVGGTWTVTIAA